VETRNYFIEGVKPKNHKNRKNKKNYKYRKCVVLMKMAREALKDKWGIAIGTFVVYTLIIIAIQVSTEFFPFAGLIVLIISGPMALGLTIFSINISRNQDVRLE